MSERMTLRLETTREWREHKLMLEALKLIREKTEPEPWEHATQAHEIAKHVVERVDDGP